MSSARSPDGIESFVTGQGVGGEGEISRDTGRMLTKADWLNEKNSKADFGP